MKEVALSERLSEEIRKIYKAMESEYDEVARALNFSCNACPDNCCDSYFLHHTYTEWAYLWKGFRELDKARQQELMARSQQYLLECAKAETKGERPQVMCPLIDDGHCTLYTHRLMVCRTHGVPASMRRPDGQTLSFPGCFRCQTIVKKKFVHDSQAPHVERTQLLQRLVAVERELMGEKLHLYPRVKLSIAQMLVNGPPAIPTPHCERPGIKTNV
jgi:Fe-S-cluster containining protein